MLYTSVFTHVWAISHTLLLAYNQFLKSGVSYGMLCQWTIFMTYSTVMGNQQCLELVHITTIAWEMLNPPHCTFNLEVISQTGRGMQERVHSYWVTLDVCCFTLQHSVQKNVCGWNECVMSVLLKWMQMEFITLTFTFIHFSWRFYPKRLTIAIYVRGHTPLEQLGVRCLAQGHIGVSQWIQTRVFHTKGMWLIHCGITTPNCE